MVHKLTKFHYLNAFTKLLHKIYLELTDIYNYRFFLKRFPVCFNLFVLHFLVTPCLVVAVSALHGVNSSKKTLRGRSSFSKKDNTIAPIQFR